MTDGIWMIVPCFKETSNIAPNSQQIDDWLGSFGQFYPERLHVVILGVLG
jgi:hypothetical protein